MNVYVIIAIDLLGCIMMVIFIEIARKISEYNDIKRKERIKNRITRKSFFSFIRRFFKRK